MGVSDSRGTLRTVDRALRVLLCFDAEHSEWRGSELARHLGWDKSVTHRLLATLTSRGFLTVDDHTRAYRLGLAIYQLGQLAARDNPMVSVVRPLLQELTRQCGETVLFTVPDGDESYCLAAVEGPAPVRYSTQVGGRLPGHVGAGSKVLFAWRDTDELRDLFGARALASYTDHTITTFDSLLTEFSSIRDRGYATSDGELDRDVGAVGAPVLHREVVVGAISIVGPLGRVQREIARLLPPLLDHAANASRRMNISEEHELQRADSTPPVTPSSLN